MLKLITPKKNMKAFGSSGATASFEGYNCELPNCIYFDKPSKHISSPLFCGIDNDLIILSPNLWCSQSLSFFCQEDFVSMPFLPLYMKNGKIADLPIDSIFSIFIAMSSYPKKVTDSSTAQLGPSASFKDVLSLNIHFVIY